MAPLKREISILSQCDSPHIVRYFGSYGREHDLWITMEYCNAGSVSDIMEAGEITYAPLAIGTLPPALFPFPAVVRISSSLAPSSHPPPPTYLPCRLLEDEISAVCRSALLGLVCFCARAQQYPILTRRLTMPGLPAFSA
eukprot:533053-Rhodomonas_salina.3